MKREEQLLAYLKGACPGRAYRVSGREPRVVDIPTGYTHNIENTGKTEMAVFMWCSETFDPKRPDTYAMKVRK